MSEKRSGHELTPLADGSGFERALNGSPEAHDRINSQVYEQSRQTRGNARRHCCGPGFHPNGQSCTPPPLRSSGVLAGRLSDGIPQSVVPAKAGCRPPLRSGCRRRAEWRSTIAEGGVLTCRQGSRLTLMAGTRLRSGAGLEFVWSRCPVQQVRILEEGGRLCLRLRCWRTCRHPAGPAFPDRASWTL